MSRRSGAGSPQVTPSPSSTDRTVLDIVIVAYRCRDLLRSCLQSLRENEPGVATSVYVVDNASEDGTVEMVRAEFDEVTLLESGHNAGFSAANNLAIEQGGGRYVLALNPDTRLTPGAIGRLVEVMDANEDIGVCGCRLVLEDGTFDHAARRSFPTIAGALGHFLRIGRTAWAPNALAQYRATSVDAGPVDAVNGAFMLMRRSALDAVGLFDEGYWMYMEDLDLCYRFREAGWVTWYEPSVTVVHVKGGTSGPLRDPRLNYAFHYGMYRFYRQHYASAHSGLTNALVYSGIATKLALALAGTSVRRMATTVRAR